MPKLTYLTGTSLTATDRPSQEGSQADRECGDSPEEYEHLVPARIGIPGALVNGDSKQEGWYREGECPRLSESETERGVKQEENRDD